MKRLIGTIIALFAFLAVAFVSEVNKKNAEKKTPTVGILQTMSHPALDQIHRGIIKMKDISKEKILKLIFKMPKVIKVI